MDSSGTVGCWGVWGLVGGLAVALWWCCGGQEPASCDAGWVLGGMGIVGGLAVALWWCCSRQARAKQQTMI